MGLDLLLPAKTPRPHEPYALRERLVHDVMQWVLPGRHSNDSASRTARAAGLGGFAEAVRMASQNASGCGRSARRDCECLDEVEHVLDHVRIQFSFRIGDVFRRMLMLSEAGTARTAGLAVVNLNERGAVHVLVIHDDTRVGAKTQPAL